MKREVGVDCLFIGDGSVQVRRIETNGRWQPVEQGRQWLDDEGRHVLVMLPGNIVQELLLRARTLRWELYSVRGGREQRRAV